MAKKTMKPKTGQPATVTFPPTTMRLDPALIYRAERLALDNKRDGKAEKTVSKVVNAALADYLGRRGA